MPIEPVMFSSITASTRNDYALGNSAGDRSQIEQKQDDKKPEKGEKTGAQGKPLSKDDQRNVEKLKRRDAEVRKHEAAHKSSGGSYAGSISYSYQTGPDGRRYAVGGEVSIDTGSESTPQATIAKMNQVKRAAMAPANPSGADRAIARTADSKIRQAQAEIAEQSQQKPAEKGKPANPYEKTTEAPSIGGAVDVRA